MRKVICAFPGVAAAALAFSAFGYSAVVSIEALIAMSEMVVVAKVVDVRESGPAERRERIATADIVATWRGTPRGRQVEYVASPGRFMCDVSSARVGESAILFLVRDPADQRYRIAHHGRGRMPLIRGNGPARARLYEVNFPADGTTHQRRLRSFPESVAVDVLERVVKRHAT